MSRLRETLSNMEKKADKANFVIKMKKVMDDYLTQEIGKIIEQLYVDSHKDISKTDINIESIIDLIMNNPLYKNAETKLEDALGIIDKISSQWEKDSKLNYPKMFE